MDSSEDVIEMSWEELQREIRQEVDNNELIAQKKNQLAQIQIQIEKREEKASALNTLYGTTRKSVAECETAMKQLYSHLGLQYRDTDSEEEQGSQSPVAQINGNDEAATKRHARDTGHDVTPEVPLELNTAAKGGPQEMRQAVVVLNKLPEHSLRSGLRQRKPQQISSDEEEFSDDSGGVWEPQSESSGDWDSDYSCSGPKSRKITEKQKSVEFNKKNTKLTSSLPVKTAKPNANTNSNVLNKMTVAETPQDMANKEATVEIKTTGATASPLVNTAKSNANANGSILNKTAVAETPQDTTSKETVEKNTKIQEPKKDWTCVPKISCLSQEPSIPAKQPSSDVKLQKIKVDMDVLAKTETKAWKEGKIVEIVKNDEDETSGTEYKVDFGDAGTKLLSGHHIAFDSVPSLEQLYVGIRVVASYEEDTKSWFCSGVLAELPSRKNRMRFLVFFDDHTPSYVGLPLLHLVCRPLKDSWEDIEDAEHAKFIEQYLNVWPNPPQAQFRLGQSLNVEVDGVQRRGEVEKIDSSLIQVFFQNQQQKLWLYRGSMRLEHMNNMKKQLEEAENKSQAEKSGSYSAKARISMQTIHSSKTSKTGFGSTSKPAESNHLKPQSTMNLHDQKQGVVTSTDIKQHSVVSYTPHRCCPACLDHIRPKSTEKQYCRRNPLLVPLDFGFHRMKASMKGSDKGSEKSCSVFYRSPCGVCLRSMAEVQDYLQQTRGDFLYLEMFCMDSCVSVLSTFKAVLSKLFIPDLSQGREMQPVSCVNELNNIRPPWVTYTSDRVVPSDISINTSLNFMVGCDCTDGCTDRVACSCHQLTVQGTALSPDGPVDVSAGYNYKRLHNSVATGIYECNAQCRCDPRLCSNRVIQNGLLIRLQIFMTKGRGWGVRCLDDLAKGTFVCTFSGRVQPENIKNTRSNPFYIKLNHIEAVEIHKPGYEVTAYNTDNEAEPMEKDNKECGGNNKRKTDVTEPQSSSEESDEDYSTHRKQMNVSILRKSYITRKNAIILQNEPETTSDSIEESAPDPPTGARTKGISSTTRSFFDDEKECYIINARTEGNLARYMNHSCSPNLFEQNVYVDTHDLRFPWLAFFTKRFIKAGTELTWDYRSIIGSVEDISSNLHCRCGASNCFRKF